MPETQPTTDEARRLLLAARDERIFMAESGRWKIHGDKPPDRRERERLKDRGLLDWKFPARRDGSERLRLVLTERGRIELERIAHAE